MNARAASAGLKILNPRPPKSCLTIITAKAEPMATIQSGAPRGDVHGHQQAGNGSPNRPGAVTRLFECQLHECLRGHGRYYTSSKEQQCLESKKGYTEYINAGRSAMTTVHIIFFIESFSRIWGAFETASNFFFSCSAMGIPLFFLF